MKVQRIDHIVLTVADIERTLAFYERVLGMTAVSFGEGRRALAFGDQKLNLHRAGREFEPKALRPTPGAIDLCLVTDVPLGEVAAHLRSESVVIEHGPVDKTGARGPLRSLYFRDPDGNLIEVSNEVGARSSPERQ
jgi:catechol 2,3-dioxygenase-like lactoylglutathione lyase family enzyme